MSRSCTSDRVDAAEIVRIADELRALARTGLHYAPDHHNRDRYDRLLSLAVRLAAAATDVDRAHLKRVFQETDSGYITPKLDARMAVFAPDEERSRVLMVRERADGRWALPGGFVDVGNSPAEAAVRETWEEASVRVRAVRLVGIFDPRIRPESPPHLFHIHKVIFLGTPLDPQASPSPGPEVHEAAYVPLSDLPELSRGRTLPVHIQEALRVARDPSALPYFD